MKGPGQHIAGFIDIEIPKPPFRWGFIIVVAIVATILFVMVFMFATSFSISRSEAIFTTFGIVAICISVAAYFLVRQAKRLRDERQRRVREGPDACARFIADHLSTEGDSVFILGILKDLLRSHITNVTMCVRWLKLGATIHPFQIPFGAVSLDESDPGFIQFEQANEVNGSNDSSSRRSPLTIDEKTSIRRIVRNVRFKGGWIMLAVIGFNATIAIITSVGKGIGTLMALLWACILVVFLLVSPTSGLLVQKQWLFVPGGLLSRTPSKKNSAQSQLHVFDRRMSILCVTQMRNRVWCVCVADSNREDWTTLTSKEMTMFLRAWLSPLEPPPVEKLVDLT